MKSLKLNCLNKNELSKISGGLKQLYTMRWSDLTQSFYPVCGCGCAYADKGGSSTESNSNANTSQGLFTYPSEI